MSRQSVVFVATLACLPVVANAQAFQPGRLPAMTRDSFEVLAQGQPGGALVVSLTRTGDTLRLVNEMSIAMGAGLRTVDTVVSSAITLMPVSITSMQWGRGLAAVSRTTVANNRATGTAQSPGRTAVQTMPINAELPNGAFAFGMEYVLLPTLDLSEGFSMTCLTYDPTTGATESCTVKVAGKETVTVPAGTYEAWKVTYTTHHTFTMFITTAEPRKLLLIRPEGLPIEMRRVSK
jgi:hypothetical protein